MNTNERKIYLAYGSNLNKEQMAIRCPNAEILGTATLEGYELLFRGGRESAVATIEPKEGSSVPVLLWSITPRCELALDRYEGFPFLYRKENVTVELNGDPLEAMVYIMNEGKPIGKPSVYYYSIIREGYKECDFSIDFLNNAVDGCIAETWKQKINNSTY